MKIRQYYSWAITSMQGFKNAKSGTFVYTPWHIVFMLLIQASSVFLSSCSATFFFPEAPAKVSGTVPSCYSRLTVAVIKKNILLKHNRQSFWLLTKWQTFGEEALEVFAVRSQESFFFSPEDIIIRYLTELFLRLGLHYQNGIKAWIRLQDEITLPYPLSMNMNSISS